VIEEGQEEVPGPSKKRIGSTHTACAQLLGPLECT
jgi:hypothetical protein